MQLRTTILLALLLLTLTGLRAQASEDFNYPVDTELAGADAGAGFDAPWSLVGGVSPVIVEGGITAVGLEQQSSGNRVAASANTRIVRSLPDGIGDDGGTYWIGYFFQTENPGPNVSHFVLADENALMATGPNGRLAQIGSGFNNANIALVGGGGTGISSLDGHFVVLEVVTNGTADNDEIFIYIDPALDAAPDRASANAMGARNLADWNAIALLQDGDPGVTANWDAITVADNFADVVPDDLIDVGVSLTAIAFEKFNYQPNQSVIGLGGAEDGWAGPWDTIASDTVFSRIVAGGVVNDGLLARTSTNSFEGTSVGANNRAIRYLDTPLTPEDNPTIWFSTHASVSGRVANNVGTIVLGDSTQDNYERIIVGKRFGNRNLFATGTGSGPTNSGAFFEGSSARYIVGRLTASDTSENWILHLWVDPQPDTEPLDEDANIADKLYPTANFNSVSIKTEGGAGLNFNVDDILLGSTYADVMPDDLSPVEPVPPGAMEPFDYAAGDSLAGQDGGSGWDGPWMLATAGNAEITEEGITSLSLLRQTSGNKVTFEAPGRIMRKLQGTYGDSGRSHWIGWWFDTDNGGSNVTNLVLANSETFPAGGAGELLQVGKAFNQGTIRIIGGGDTGASADEGHFVVVEVVTNGVGANDEVYVWIDPALDNTPSRDTADATGGRNLMGWDAIGLKVAGDPGVIAKWDDIYVGNSYRDVVPSDLIEVQNPDLPVVATEPFDYTPDLDLDGQDGGEGWGGPWAVSQGEITIAEGSVESDRVAGTGNRANLSQRAGNAVRYSRPYFTRYAADSPEKQTVWFSYLLDVTNNGIGNQGGVALLDGDNPIIQVGAVAGLSNVGVSYNGGAPRTSTSVSANTANWVVVRLDLYGSGVVDTGFVWINPTSDVLPDTANAEFKLYDMTVDNGFDQVGLRASGALDLELQADELYTGFSFRDVSPGFGSDDPDLLAYEPFNYDAGESLFGLGGINAFWDGTWMDAGNFGGVNELLITEGSLGMDGLPTVGNKAEFAYLEAGTTMRADRDLAFPVVSDGREYWVTFFMNTTEFAAPNTVANITLRSSATPAQNDGMRMSIGRMFSNTGPNKLGFVTPPSGNARRSEIDDEGLHWLVVRIGTNADVTVPDTVEMWIDPAMNERPDTSTAVIISTIGVLKDAPIDVIRIRTEGSGGNQTPYITNFDELRIATSWASATLTSNAIAPEEDDVFELTAYPNPFGNELNIRFQADRPGRYALELYDVNGRRVGNLLDAEVPAGEQQLRWNNTDLANGFYFLRVVNGNRSTVRKLLLYR